MRSPGEASDTKERSGAVTALLWLLTAASVVVLACAWMPMFLVERAASGGLGSWFWAVDVLASLSSIYVWGILMLAVMALLLRRFAAAAILEACALGLVVLPMSEARLVGADVSEETLSLVVYNAHTQSAAVADKHALLARADADVVVMLETSTGMMRSLIAKEGVRETHPYGWLPSAVWSSCPAVMSRYPVTPEAESAELREIRRRLWDHLYRMEIVHAPGGSVAMIQAHARSPRRAERWAWGLAQLNELADIVREVEAITGLPVVVAGDFNSTPTGVRARAFAARSGLVRAKPAMRLGGTYPAWSPVLLALPIDGVYASPGVRVTSWEVMGSAGSDHRALRVGLAIGSGG